MTSRPLTFLLAAGLLGLASTAYADAYNLTVFDIPGSGYTTINGINNKGQFVGDYSFDGVDHGYVQSPGGVTTYIDDPNATGFNGTVAKGINDNGDVVGIYYTDPNTLRAANSAFKYTAATGYQDIGYGIRPDANNITDDGQVFGTIESGIPSTSAIIYHAYLDYGNNTSLAYPAAGEVDPTVQTYGGRAGTFGLGINTYGAMVGGYYAYAPGSPSAAEHGYSYTTNGFSVIEPLGATESEATGINDTGVITGWFGAEAPNGSSIVEGFVDVNGQYQPIEVPGAHITVVTGINNAGDIVGYFSLATGGDHGFIGTPAFSLPPTGFVRGPFAGFPADVPEPATWVMMITGLGMVGTAIRRRPSRPLRA